VRTITEIERRVAEQIALEEIKCPACGYQFDPDEQRDHVTVWGDDEPKDDECPECQAELTIDETVTREFEVTLRDGG